MGGPSSPKLSHAVTKIGWPSGGSTRLLATTATGKAVSFPLYGHSVASSYRDTVQALAALGVQVHIDKPTPFDLPGARPALRR